MTTPVLVGPAEQPLRQGAGRLRVWRQRFDHNGRRLLHHLAEYAHCYILAMAVWATTLHFVAFNLTDSVPEHVILLQRGAAFGRGDLVMFDSRATGAPAALNIVPWLKRVKGMPGDTVSVRGREVWVNDTLIGIAKERTGRGKPLHIAAPGVIPPGHYFVSGNLENSLDSRYAEVGLIRHEQIRARGVGLW